MTILRAAALVVAFASIALADTVTCPGPGGSTIQKPLINASAPAQCGGSTPRPVDAYSLDLLSGWRQQRDAQICICYHPQDLALCQATRNYLYDVQHQATQGRVACLAYGVGLYENEKSAFSIAVQSAK